MYDVLYGNVEYELRNILHSIADRYEYEIKELEIMPNHIHMFVSTKPTVSATDVVRTFKSISAIMLFKQFPNLKKFYSRCGVLYRKGYFASTVGTVSAATVKRYIQEQKTKTL
ncbi:IS200/IS605 family transposase [Bacillus sp. FJAT-27445]|uniref:IS200/IS605 family transposase n=1 Tax=Bacillus sp. FJAT-27445 TaxID=1679166 RepID=UPI003461D499